MLYIRLPHGTDNRDLPFFLAMEEWATEVLPANEYFFSWSVGPTVICGRNQEPQAEIDLDFCRKHSISAYQRKSGGGCVYADHGNLMMSYITSNSNVEQAFALYLDMVTEALRRAGIDAARNGRNDIMVGDRKISGNACFRTRRGCIVHGTLLYDTDMDNMLGALTPSRAKLASNGVTSVAARIGTLRRLAPQLPSFDSLRSHMTATLTDSELTLDTSQVRQIEQFALSYRNLTC